MNDKIKSYKLSPQLKAELNFQKRLGRHVPKINFSFFESIYPVRKKNPSSTNVRKAEHLSTSPSPWFKNRSFSFSNGIKFVKLPWRSIAVTAGVFLIIISAYIGIRKGYEYSARKSELARQEQLDKYNAHLAQINTEVEGLSTTALAAVQASQNYIKSGDAERAEAAAKIATVKDPKWRDGFVNLGQIYLSLNKFDLAKEALDQALNIDPLNGQTHYLLSLVYQELNDSNSAKTEFAKAKTFGFEAEIGG